MGFRGARKWIVDYGSNYDNPSDCFKVGSNRINKEPDASRRLRL